MVGFIITARPGESQPNDHHNVNRQQRYRQDAGSYQRTPALQIPKRA